MKAKRIDRANIVHLNNWVDIIDFVSGKTTPPYLMFLEEIKMTYIEFRGNEKVTTGGK